jgi:hypothetical protein
MPRTRSTLAAALAALAATSLALAPAQTPPADAEAVRLQEDLHLARSRGDQKAAVAALLRLCELRPDDAAFPLLLGETHASLGPEFAPARARTWLETFLELTDPARGPADARTRDQRIHARQLLLDLGRSSPPKLLLHPDRTVLERRVRQLERDQQRLTRDKADTDKSLSEARKQLHEASGRYESARARSQPGRFVDVTELWTRVLDRRQQVNNCERRAGRLAQDLERTRTELRRHEQRLAAFGVGS